MSKRRYSRRAGGSGSKGFSPLTRSRSSSAAKEIGGERIDVRRGGWREKGILLDGLVKLFAGGGTAALETKQIEGDEVSLEDTEAEVVRGKKVEIGPGCRIGRVEYSESLKVASDAVVKERVKV